MANRIDPMSQGTFGKIGNKVDEAKATGKAAPSPSASQDAASPATTGDTVDLTSSAKLLARLDKMLEALPAVNAERVAEIRHAIESGDYEIDADGIAEAMIRLDRSLGE